MLPDILLWGRKTFLGLQEDLGDWTENGARGLEEEVTKMHRGQTMIVSQAGLRISILILGAMQAMSLF